MKRSGGQSLMEFAAGVAAFGLLAIGTIAIATYQESQRRLIGAARQAAFDLEWQGGRPARQPEREALFESHFADRGLVVPLTGRPLLEIPDFVVHHRHQELSGEAAAAQTLLAGTLRTPPGMPGSGMDLGNRGLLDVRVGISVRPMAELPPPFRAMAVPMVQPMALLADSWSASDPRQVSDRVSGLVPLSRLRTISTALQPLMAPLSLLEPSLDRLCLGLIEPDAVPEDRLGAGVPASWNSCR